MSFLKPLPSAIEAVVFSYGGEHISLRVQRDDLVHPLITGNKYRKLQAFYQPNAKGYVSFGGAWSNHLLAVAAMARMQGVQAVGIIRGDENRPSNTYEGWLKQLGMQLLFVSREQYRNKTTLYADAILQFPGFNLIPEGGFPQPNHIAFDAWVSEIPKNVSHILISCGTGASLLGLARALNKTGSNAALIGVSAIGSLSFTTGLQAEARQLYTNSFVHAPPDGKRFGNLSDARLALAKSFFAQTGIAPDPIYDTQLLQFVVKQFQLGLFKSTDNLIWLHSGGTTGWAGFSSESQQLFSL